MNEIYNLLTKKQNLNNNFNELKIKTKYEKEQQNLLKEQIKHEKKILKEQQNLLKEQIKHEKQKLKEQKNKINEEKLRKQFEKITFKINMIDALTLSEKIENN